MPRIAIEVEPDYEEDNWSGEEIRKFILDPPYMFEPWDGPNFVVDLVLGIADSEDLSLGGVWCIHTFHRLVEPQPDEPIENMLARLGYEVRPLAPPPKRPLIHTPLY
jgi:hypothetical protein